MYGLRSSVGTTALSIALLACSSTRPTASGRHVVFEESATSPGDHFGLDGATIISRMRLAKVEGTTGGAIVWLGDSERKLMAVKPTIVESILDAAAGAPGAGIVDDELPLGDPLLALDGLRVNVLDDSFAVMCEGRLAETHLRYAGFVTAGEGPDLTELLLADGAPTILATLTAPCTGSYVSGLRAPALRDVATRPDAIPEPALQELETWEPDAQQGSVVQLIAGDTGFVHVQVDTPDTCARSEEHHWTLYRATRDSSGWSFAQLAEGNGDDSIERVLDVDGDGELDVLTTRGAYVGKGFHEWKPDLRLYWPAGLGCDGHDDTP